MCHAPLVVRPLRRLRRAFTLIELLVVVAIIALLIAILLPSLGRAREMTRRVTCAANLRGIGQDFVVYAAANNDFLPVAGTTSGGWMHDESPEFTDLMMSLAAGTNPNLSTTSVRRLFYCPNTTDKNLDSSWWPNGTPPAPPSYRALGYAMLNYRGPGGTFAVVNTLRLSPPLDYQKKLSLPRMASDIELSLDEIIAYTGAGIPYNGLNSDWAGTGKGINGTNHLGKSSKPAGANTLFMDGHVTWREYVFAKALDIPMTNGNGHYSFPSP